MFAKPNRQELETLATFSDVPAPAVPDLFSETDRKARAWLKNLCAEAGLQVREDAVGNTFARWADPHPTCRRWEADPTSTPFLTPGADGTVGVLGALEAIRALQRAGIRPVVPSRILFTSRNHALRHRLRLGSRLLSGTLDPARASALSDGDGASLDQVRAAAGFSGRANVQSPCPLRSTTPSSNCTSNRVSLERAGTPIGIVTAIAAPAT
jgi:N-carbamoyl-L-amino-acid hydrolase